MRVGKLEYQWRDFWYGLATFVSGAGVGWFLGLGLESLTTAVFGPVVTLITGAATVLAGIGVATEQQAGGPTRANPIMVMLLVLGLVGGSVLSSSLRANLALAPSSITIASKTHLTDKEVNQRVFDKLYPPAATASTTTTTTATPPTDTKSTTETPTVPPRLDELQCSWLSLNDTDLMEHVRAMKDPILHKASPTFIKEKLQQKCSH